MDYQQLLINFVGVLSATTDRLCLCFFVGGLSQLLIDFVGVRTATSDRFLVCCQLLRLVCYQQLVIRFVCALSATTDRICCVLSATTNRFYWCAIGNYR